MTKNSLGGSASPAASAKLVLVYDPDAIRALDLELTAARAFGADVVVTQVNSIAEALSLAAEIHFFFLDAKAAEDSPGDRAALDALGDKLVLMSDASAPSGSIKCRWLQRPISIGDILPLANSAGT